MDRSTLITATVAASLAVGVACGFLLSSFLSPPLDPLVAATLELGRAKDHLVAERTGRIRAERALREHVNRAMATVLGYPVLPIGRIASPFRGRWGTPRQGMLAPDSRAHLLVAPEIPFDALRGLDAYSHVWVIFLFNENSSMHKLGAGEAGAAKAGRVRVGGGGGGKAASSKDQRGGAAGGKDESVLRRALRERHFNALIEAPALKGGRTGVLSTRSPHRPNAIGLSLCRLVATHQSAPGAKGNAPVIVLAGCDLIDGTLVIDVKPYAPYDCPVCIGSWLNGQERASHAGGMPSHIACTCAGGSASAGAASPAERARVPPPFSAATDLPSAFAALSAGADLTSPTNYALRGPAWVYDSLRNQAAARLPVLWEGGTADIVAGAVRAGRTRFYGAAAAALHSSAPRSAARAADGSADVAAAAALLDAEVSSALAALTQVLALDIRAVHHGRGGAPSTTRGGAALKRRMGKGGVEGDDAGDDVTPEPGVQYFELWFDVFDLRFTIRELGGGGGSNDAGGARWFVTVTHVGIDSVRDDESAAAPAEFSSADGGEEEEEDVPDDSADAIET